MTQTGESTLVVMVYEMRGRLIKTENIYTRRFEAEKQFLKSQRNKGAESF